jgi:hypothetical protein
LVSGIGQLVYGALLVWQAFNSFPWTSSTTDPHAIPAVSVSAALLLIAILVIALGTRQIIRRLQTRSFRKRVGALDDLTIEGSAWIKAVPRAVARRLHRK